MSLVSKIYFALILILNFLKKTPKNIIKKNPIDTKTQKIIASTGINTSSDIFFFWDKILQIQTPKNIYQIPKSGKKNKLIP